MDFVKNLKIRNKLSWSFGLMVMLMTLPEAVALISFQIRAYCP